MLAAKVASETCKKFVEEDSNQVRRRVQTAGVISARHAIAQLRKWPMLKLRDLSNLGIRVYGLAAIAMGLIGLVGGDFATVWQPVPPEAPHRVALAYLTAVCLLLAGAVTQWRRTAPAGVLVLAVLYSIFALLWLPRVLGFPRMIGTWLGFAEEFALVAAAAVAYRGIGQTKYAVGGEKDPDRPFPVWPLRGCIRTGPLSGSSGNRRHGAQAGFHRDSISGRSRPASLIFWRVSPFSREFWPGSHPGCSPRCFFLSAFWCGYLLSSPILMPT